MLASLRRWRRQRALRTAEIPEDLWREALELLPFLAICTDEEFLRLRAKVILFLYSKAIVGARGHRVTPLQRVVIRESERVHVLPVDRIDYIEAQDDYLSFVANGKRFRKQQTLADIEKQLDRARFVRVHRSFILNVERLARIEPYAKDSWLAILGEGARLPVSRAGYDRLKALLG